MSYGISGLDLGKGVVFLSCVFPLFMTFLIAKDPTEVIQSQHSGGWWDVLDSQDDRAAIYPRIWASSLLFQTAVRLNWVFTVEPAPALYRCVLLSYVIFFAEYCLEIYLYETLPPFDPSLMFLISVGPWFAIVIDYKKYTNEGSTTKTKKE